MEGTDMQGVVVFDSVASAERAGFEIEKPPCPDENGMLRARTMTGLGWARVLVKVGSK